MSAVRAIGRWVLAGALLVARGLLPRRPPPARRGGRGSRAELAVAAALAAGGAAGGAFVAAYALGAGTQVLGLALGGALACLAVAAIVAGTRVAPQAVRAERRPPVEHPEEQDRLADEIRAGGEAVTRRRLLVAAGGCAALGVAAAAATPIASLGPRVGRGFGQGPGWASGRLLVDAAGRAVRAADVAVGGVVTAFPDGGPREELWAPVVLLRLREADLELPPERAGWAPGGLMAFSRTCTHAACAVSEFRYPLARTAGSRPALVCPCHYSVFDVPVGGARVFGPAARDLPQLPLSVDGAGLVRAAGALSAPAGPSWLLTRT